MSWTVPKPKEDQQSDAYKRLKKAVKQACDANVLMFGSSPDEGQFNDAAAAWPTHLDRKIFRIGAAKDDGTAYSYASTDVDYIFPGVNINADTTVSAAVTGTSDALGESGSSIATALAAGFAAVVICCVKICALANKMEKLKQLPGRVGVPGREISESDVVKIGQPDPMRKAFSVIKVNPAKYIEVWDTFGEATQRLNAERSNEARLQYLTADLCVTWIVSR